MTIEKSILDVTDGYILHQANARGVAGKGLALALRRKFPDAFIPYFDYCRSFPGKTGVALITRGWPAVVHILGQDHPGPNTDLAAVDLALEDFATKAKPERWRPNRPVYVPYRMGCGIGGANWNDYYGVIKKHIPQAVICKLPAPI
jgi:hypothetical protein